MKPTAPTLITGCSTGIGRATAERLAAAGRTVYATARKLESIADLEQKAVEDEHGAVGALVNNAGYAVSGALEAVPIDAVRKEFETNVFGYVRMAQAARPHPRYRVTPISRVLPKLRGVLGDRGFDAFLRSQIKPPGI